MQINLKNTILASSALAGMLNLVQFAVSYDQHARASFVPSWADASTASPSPGANPAATKAATLATTSMPTTASAPAPTPASTASEPSAIAATKLTTAGLKADYAASYLAVQAQTGTPWQLLAAVHHTETGQRGDSGIKSYAGATGPMQFMPATFRAYALDGDGDGAKNITDLDDAMLTAGRYLAANGATRGNYQNALYHYNHSNAYVTSVLNLARRLGL